MGITTTTCMNPFAIISFFSICVICYAADTIFQGQSIADGETIVSTNQTFALGFFSPGNSSSRYVGIWYNNIPVKSIVWVANKDRPIFEKNGVLTIGDDGNLMVFDGNKVLIWSTNVSVGSVNATAVLKDNGNLELSGGSNDMYWQSFKHPTDTYLPGMRVLVDAAMGENRVFTSWTSVDDPSPGKYSMGVDPRGAPQIVIWEGLNRLWRSGQWNQQIFTGIPTMASNYLYGFKLSPHDNGSMYFTYVPSNSSDLLRFWIGWNGIEEELRWDPVKEVWFPYQSQPANECEFYNKCGNFGICNVNDARICSCMEGFVPKNVGEWNKGNWSDGCVRKTELQCQRNSSVNGEDGFLPVDWVKLPDFADQVNVENSSTCKDECLKNCSCKAYAFVVGIPCMIWTGELVDIQKFDKTGETVYIRVDGSELGGGSSKLSLLIIIIIFVGGALFIGVLIWLLWRFRAKFKDCPKASSISWWKKSSEISIFDVIKSEELSTEVSGPNVVEVNPVDGTELQLFTFKSVAAATNNFSVDNKLGKGGFGPVYKGKLPGGQEIAVKRLSRMSGQGAQEFKNEIILIAKLQHRNLVRLLGCCIEAEEKILLYEYMPNKSLDCFLFDPANQAKLGWTVRFSIIEGIARGLLYLHRDSRLRIIHRDLKASNILLDEEMTPKISDFGMARIFGGNQNDEANTIRVVGTYGYMSPEYAMEGLFSVKSDVYSFGVLLLEIVSGRRNTSFRSSEHLSLLGYAWNLWNDGRAMELVDPSIGNSYSRYEVLRCIQVGMLCVQDLAVSRPTMSSVVLMLETDTLNLPLPRQPTFTSMRSSVDTEFTMEHQDLITSSDMTVSSLTGR